MRHFVPSLRALLTLNALIAVLALLTAACLALWGVYTFSNYHKRASHSYEQLALAMSLETNIGFFLITEIKQFVDPANPSAEVTEIQKIEQNLSALIQTIDEEINFLDGERQKAEEQAEYQTVHVIDSLFQKIRRTMRKERLRAEVSDRAEVVHDVINNIVSVDYRRLSEIVHRLVAEERLEVKESVENIRLLGWNILFFSISAIILTMVFALGGAMATYNVLMRPVAQLSKGSQALAQGDLDHRITIARPPEFAELADRFNNMAQRISFQKTQLADINQGLEKIVAERTQELAEKINQLAKIDDSRRLFFAKIGHELRTPLTVLLGEADVALRRLDSDPAFYRQALTHIAANGEFLKRRISDLIGLARSEDGRIVLENRPMDLETVVDDAVQVVQSFAHSSGVVLQTSLPEQPVVLQGDQSWLRQSMLTLIDNAVKFSPKDGVVEIRLERHQTAAIIDVIDQGFGVPDTDLHNVFDPYYQSANGRGSGSGLGLAVAHWVAKHHQGWIKAENLTPRGFRIRMELPLKP